MSKYLKDPPWSMAWRDMAWRDMAGRELAGAIWPGATAFSGTGG